MLFDNWEEIKPKYKIKDTVYVLYDNEIVCAKIYAIKIEAISLFKKQLHNSGANKLESKVFYKIVCEQTRCNDRMEDYFRESELFDSEYECINNITRIK